MCYHKSVSSSVNPMSRSKTGRRIKVLKSSDTTYEVDSAVRIRLKATTDVVSLLFSSSSSEVLEILCSTGASTIPVNYYVLDVVTTFFWTNGKLRA